LIFGYECGDVTISNLLRSDCFVKKKMGSKWVPVKPKWKFKNRTFKFFFKKEILIDFFS